MTWRWITKSALLLLHGESVAEHGGADGLRDEGLLDSALSRPLNLVAYADPAAPPDFAALAASYTVGLAKNLYAQVNYNAEVGRSNSTVQSVNAGLRFEF